MSPLLNGLVIAHLGQGIAVEHAGKIYLCQTLRKLETVVVGDRVQWLKTSLDQGRIESIEERHSVLLRPNRNGSTRPVAANIDNLFIVFAYEPLCDFLLLDQYLAICEHYHIQAHLVLNKADLDPVENVLEELSIYQALGYPLHQLSARTGQGLDALKASMHKQTNMLAGQSGVGKSSLTNALLPDSNLKTNTVSTLHKHGRHTTTAATLYHLPSGGELIDSPGVSIFGLAGLNEQQLAQSFREFAVHVENCRFLDCRHVKDQGCAVRAASEQGQISQNRYQRYLKLREKMQKNN